MVSKIVVGIVLGILLIAGVLAITSFIFMIAWNTIAPAFNWSTLNFTQSFALWLLIGLIGSAFKATRHA